MNAEYLEKVRNDTLRGLRGCFDRKLATGGAPFGYRTVPIVVGLLLAAGALATRRLVGRAVAPS